MDSLTISLIGLTGMFALIALHVPIGVAMGLSGVASVAMMLGWDPALSLVKTEASAVFSHRDLGVMTRLGMERREQRGQRFDLPRADRAALREVIEHAVRGQAPHLDARLGGRAGSADGEVPLGIPTDRRDAEIDPGC